MGVFVWQGRAKKPVCGRKKAKTTKFSPPFGLEPAHMGSRVSRLGFNPSEM
jgi:hypothetical protein